MNYWKYYKSARLRELYKNHYLKHYGLTPLEVQCIMRKFKIIVDTADKDYKNLFCSSMELQAIIEIISMTLNSIKKPYLKEAYKDILFYFIDYSKFIITINRYMELYTKGKDVSNIMWPDNSSIDIRDIPKVSGTMIGNAHKIDADKTYYIRLKMKDKEFIFYSGIDALLSLCMLLGIDRVIEKKNKLCGKRLFLTILRKEQEEYYKKIDERLYICIFGNIRGCIKLMRDIIEIFQEDIKIEWDIYRNLKNNKYMDPE